MDNLVFDILGPEGHALTRATSRSRLSTGREALRTHPTVAKKLVDIWNMPAEAVIRRTCIPLEETGMGPSDTALSMIDGLTI